MKLNRGIFAAAVLVLAGGSAHADVWGLSVYGGWNGSLNSDVHFSGSDTDWTVSDVPWDGLSLTQAGGPPYYGVRLSMWPTAMPAWGFALDFTHVKARAVRDATVDFHGTIDGAQTDGSDQIQNLFDQFEFTDGLNLLTLNAIYRLPTFGFGRPYIGAGAGISIPHVEVTGNRTRVPFPRTFAYEFGGPALQLIAGTEIPINARWSLFGEYKLSWTHIDAPLSGGDRIETTVITNHLLAGATFKFGR